MPNPFFSFKQFTVHHDRCAMKVTTDACLFGAWCASDIQKENAKGKHILDIGCGTGLLSLMIAQKNEAEFDAIEIDEGAARQAKENIAASLWPQKIKVHHADVLNYPFSVAYDYIISNPPFYEKEIPSSSIEKNKAHHGDSLRFSELVEVIKTNMTAKGIFYLLLPYKRIEEIQSILLKKELHIDKLVVVSSSETHAPFRLLLKGRRQPVSLKKRKFFIYKEEKLYTDEFIQLLKDYYLYL